MTGLRKANTDGASSKEVIARLERDFTYAWAKRGHDVVTFQTLADAEQYMLHAAVRDHSRLQIFLDEERQKCQTV